MRLGVLDVGSNTVHLLVVDAHRGAHPTPMTSEKTELRLAEHLDRAGRLTESGADALVAAVSGPWRPRPPAGCEECWRSPPRRCATRGTRPRCCARVRAETGVALQVLPGEDEARYTFLAVRRWYGWSAGRLLVLDIGGGSLELAAGRDEDPDVAVSLPLGAGRLTRTLVHRRPAVPRRRSTALRRAAGRRAGAGRPAGAAGGATFELAVGTSKTFRSLARLTGAAPSSAGPRVRRVLTDAGLRQLVAFISRMSSPDLAELEGVSAGRAHQLVAGALVAEAAMRALRVSELEICPWALREGVILRRLDTLGTPGPSESRWPLTDGHLRPAPDLLARDR